MKGMRKLKGNDDEYSRQVRSKIAGTSSDKRKMAQRISALKLTKAENLSKNALQLARNPMATAFTIMQMVQIMGEREDLTPQLQIQLIRALSDAYRTIHGTKQSIDSKITSKNTEIKIIIPKEVKELIEEENRQRR